MLRWPGLDRGSEEGLCLRTPFIDVAQAGGGCIEGEAVGTRPMTAAVKMVRGRMGLFFRHGTLAGGSSQGFREGTGMRMPLASV